MMGIPLFSHIMDSFPPGDSISKYKVASNYHTGPPWNTPHKIMPSYFKTYARQILLNTEIMTKTDWSHVEVPNAVVPLTIKQTGHYYYIHQYFWSEWKEWTLWPKCIEQWKVYEKIIEKNIFTTCSIINLRYIFYIDIRKVSIQFVFINCRWIINKSGNIRNGFLFIYLSTG